MYYQAHHTEWLFLGFVVCLGLAVALVALAQFKKLKPLNYAFIVLLGLAIVLFMTMSRLKVSDNAQFRQELKDINILSVSNLTLRVDGSSRDIASPNEVNLLFNQLRQVQKVFAHHSFPTTSYEVKFEIDGQEYQYRVALDSDRADEYWVFETARAERPGREIGRIHSSTLGQVLNTLTHDATPSKP